MGRDLFLPRRHDWFLRIMGVPAEPRAGDRGPVRDALYEIVDAAGGLEYSRAALREVIAIAQEEFNVVCISPHASNWAGASTPAVYYEFCNAVAWTRGFDDRYKDRLRPALLHDLALWKRCQALRSKTAGSEFEDARSIAKCGLHKFTPPYANFSAKVKDGTLVYPVVDRIIDPENFRSNLQFAAGRHVTALVGKYWGAVVAFIEQLLDVFYPP